MSDGPTQSFRRAVGRLAGPTWRPLWIVGAVATSLRVVWVLVMSRPPAGLSDPILYLNAAEGIARGEGYRSLMGTVTSYYPPGYPYALGGLRWALGVVGAEAHLVLATGLMQAVLGGVTAAAVCWVGARLSGPALGWVAGLLVAFWPNLVVHSSLFLSETLFLALFSLVLCGLVEVTRSGGRDRLVLGLTSVGLGAATLVRPQSALLLLPAAALAWAIGGAGWRTVLTRCAVLAVGVVVVVAPWTIRNAVVLGGFVPVSTNTGDNLCVGFHDGAPGGFAMPEACDTGEFYTDGPAAELRRDAETRRRAIEWATSNPGELPALSLRKLVATFEHDHDGIAALEAYGEDPFLSERARGALKAASDLYYLAVVVAALAGVAVLVAGRRRSRDPAMLMLITILAGALVVPVATFGDARFKVSVAPVLALLAGIGALRAARFLRRRTGRGREAPAEAAELA